MNKVNLILHAHLPYVRHVEYPKFLEENWLFESLNETSDTAPSAPIVK